MPTAPLPTAADFKDLEFLPFYFDRSTLHNDVHSFVEQHLWRTDPGHRSHMCA